MKSIVLSGEIGEFLRGCHPMTQLHTKENIRKIRWRIIETYENRNQPPRQVIKYRMLVFFGQSGVKL